MPIHYKGLAEELANRGHKVTIIFADRFNAPIGKVDEKLNFKSIKFRYPKVLSLPIISKVICQLGLSEKFRFSSDSKKISSRLQNLNSECKFDIIESPNNGACFDMVKNDQTCIRIATTDKEHSLINNTEISPYLRELFRAEGKTFKNCRNLVTHTRAHRDKICKEYKLEPKNFTLIPLSVRIPKNTELDVITKNQNLTILFVGRFEKRKGIDLLLALIPKVLEKEPNAIFRLVGPDNNKLWQTKLSKEHPGLLKNVYFLGEKRGKELDAEYRHCDIFIAPSRYESFGLIYAEAMSFAKPVIGTKIGGIPEVIDHEINGFLCENENPEDFSNKLLILLANHDLRIRMGKSGRKKAMEHFDFQNMVTRTEDYYREIMINSKGEGLSVN